VYEVNKMRLIAVVLVLCVLIGIVAAMITHWVGINPRSFGAQLFGLAMVLSVVMPLNMFIQRRVRKGGFRWLRQTPSVEES